MRRLIVPALCAGAVAAPIPVALAQTGPEIAGQVAAGLAERHLVKAELRREAGAAKRSAKRRAAAKRDAKTAAPGPVSPQLAAIAQCESGGNPSAVSANGLYHGKYQFSVDTWAAVGGTGLPSRAPEAEQDMRAAMLYARSGPGQWPVCGR